MTQNIMISGVTALLALTRRGNVFLCNALIIAGLSGCASTDEATDGTNSRPVRVESIDELVLAREASEIGSVQLYRTGNEAAPPLIAMNTPETLTLAFDLLSSPGQTLSVYFYHANRNWRRDLMPIEYMRSYQRDELIRYDLSQATDVPYLHYSYEFPTRDIEFTMSGNYILRITEFGDEEAILFERPFFVAEQQLAITLTLDNVLIPGQPYSGIQPLGRFQPDREGVNIFDYTMCFVRNDQYATAKCSTRASLGVQPGLAFYLEPYDAFQLVPPPFFLDLSAVRVGGRIEYMNRSVNPPEVALEPDYARFPGSGFGPFLNGQIVIAGAVTEYINPHVGSEYVRVYFRYVPINEVRARGNVIVTGTFNNWERDLENALEWLPDKKWYEGYVLMKQGHHEYRYLVDDPILQRAATGAPPGTRNLYTAFLYSADIRTQSDRLISTRGILVQ